jgi:hypothetical protein
MSDTDGARWCDANGRWHEGPPPAGWWQANDGRWFPPLPAPPPDPSTWRLPVPPPPRHVASEESGIWSRIWSTYGRWPTGARIGAPLVAGILVVGLVGSLIEPRELETVERDEPVSTTVPRTTITTLATTTTSTTTTTVPPTTTTEPPPSTTAPPPPPTTAPPPPPTTVPPTTTAPAPRCHPSYRPCVPIASDVDCRGFGDGPVFVDGPIEVIGPDEYNLDRNDNGIGCEF